MAVASRTGEPSGIAVPVCCGFGYLIIALIAACKGAFPNHYDELAHLSYVASLWHEGVAGVDFHRMRLLAQDLSPGFTQTANYLNHPPAYYAMLSWLLPADGWPTPSTVLVLRLLNACLSATAVAAALAIGVRRGLTQPALLCYSLMVIVTPALWGIGGAINNDNLAYLGGSAAVLGAQLLLEPAQARAGRLLLPAGCAVALLAKLTAGVMVGGFALLFLALRWKGRQSLPLLYGLAAAMMVVSLPYLWLFLAYGSPAPATPALAAEYKSIAELLAAHADVHVNFWDPHLRPGFPSYALQFAWWLLADWNPAFGSVQAIALAIAVVPAAMLALAGWSWLRGWTTDRDPLLAAGGVAIAALVPLHLVFSYRMHLATGAPPFDAVPRYYLPLTLALVPLAACRTLAAMPDRLQRPAISMLIAALALVPPAIVLAGRGG